MTREEAVAAILCGTAVTRAMIQDGLADPALLESDPFWECDPMTANWFKRTTEFFAARGLAEQELAALGDAPKIALAAELLSLEAYLPPSEDSPAQRFAPNGLDYVTVCSTDVWSTEGHATPKEAIDEWRRRLLVFVAERPAAELTWWRDKPEIEGRVPFGQTSARWLVYSRLMVGSHRELAERYASALVNAA
jgi:hypothetical protein